MAIAFAAAIHSTKIATNTTPIAAMENSAGERSTSKVFSQETGRPLSRRRLSSYSPVPANGPISAKPAARG